MSKSSPIYFWFRRDLRLDDNAALYHSLRLACESGRRVRCVFIFDTEILSALDDRDDARVTFIYDTLVELQKQLRKLESDLIVWHGNPVKLWAKHANAEIFANHDYEPSAIERDKAVSNLRTYKDQCIFEKAEVVKDDGKPYTVFTPYKNKWLKHISDFYFKSYPVSKWHRGFDKFRADDVLSLKTIGFERSSISVPPCSLKKSLITTYDKTRNTPALEGTSRISVHLRFGTISIRECARFAQTHNAIWLSELIWRDFFMQILWHFPHVVGGAFRPAYDRIKWRNNKSEFAAWCEGRTGYSLVDAGMRELNETGHMHNRVRMLTASFLVKDLLIDWRWGERYFARRLLDYDLSANNGNWQWAAGTGCDAAPYFRVFSPVQQQKKFDREYKYVRRWVPDFHDGYLPEIVDHAEARIRALKAYKTALRK